MLNGLVQTCLNWQMGTTSVKECVMGFVEVNVNGQWMNLMSMSVHCQLCNDEVIIAHLANIETADAPFNATWTCKKCHSVNG